MSTNPNITKDTRFNFTYTELITVLGDYEILSSNDPETVKQLKTILLDFFQSDSASVLTNTVKLPKVPIMPIKTSKTYIGSIHLKDGHTQIEFEADDDEEALQIAERGLSMGEWASVELK
jgi:hypothetical protein